MGNKIVFVNQSSGYLMIDIINAHKASYDERVLISGFLNPRNNPLDEGVTVKKIVEYNRSSSLKRAWTWAWGFIKALWLIKTKYRKAHLFLVSNPPFSTLIPLFCNNTFSLLIYDVYPDALVEYKIIKEDSRVIKWWKKKNKKLYPKASKIFTLSNGMKNLLSQYVHKEKIDVVPVWTDNSFLKPVPKVENPFATKQGLQDKFVVMYSGNLGKTHNVEVLVKLAKELKKENIFFMIIGGGEKYTLIEKMIKESSLQNIRLLPWQPTEMLPYTISSADIGIVSLGKEASLLSVPSKTFNLMSVGVPILAFADQSSELAQLIKHHNIGTTCAEDDISKMKDFLLSTMKAPHVMNELKKNTLDASIHFGPENALKFIN